MRGPGLRHDLEIRRTFLCPKCGRKVLRLGDVVSQACPCTDPPTWMLIQPDPQKRSFQFEKIVVPLTEEDLVIRERPRRMPEPLPEGAPENDRRPQRPKRPKPERRSFESFQEDLAAKVQAESNGAADAVMEIVESIEVEVTEVTQVEATQTDIGMSAQESQPQPPEDEFGQGL